MLTFKTIEKEQEKKMKDEEDGQLPSDEKERKKKLMKFAVIGTAALVGGFLIYKYVIVKNKTHSLDVKTAEF